MVGAWLFSDAPKVAGQTIDYSGNYNDGTLVDDASSVPGRFGSALDFPGSGDYVLVADSPSLGITQAITVIAWVKTGDDDKAIVCHYETDSNQRAWYLGVHSDGTIRALITDNGTSTTSHRKDYRGSASFNDSEWHFIGITYEGSSDTLSLYVDGVLDDSPTKDDDPNISSIHNSTGDLSIAALMSAGSPGDEVTGQIDHVTIYNTALVPGEMAELFGDPFVDWHPKPIELWSDKVPAVGGAAGMMTTWGGFWGPTY